MAYHNGQPFNKNHLRPCPMLENPELLEKMVHETGAHSTDLQSPESVEHLCEKCKAYAADWQPTADEIWSHHKIRESRLLTTSDAWKQINGLFTGNPEIPQEIQDQNREIYRNFIEGTNGKRIVYLNGYTELRRFLVNVLKWQDDDNHTLPQMKEYKNFILMTEPEKGYMAPHQGAAR